MQFWRNDEKESTFYDELIPKEDLIPVNWEADGKSNQVSADYHLEHLPPATRLTVQLCVKNNFYVGRPSDPVSFQTPEGGISSSYR